MTLLPPDNPPPSTRPSPAWRDELLVALALAAVAAWVLLSSLGTSRMEPDESLYALATDHVRATGEWLTLRPHPPAPYFNKPPLYVWLSALTYDRLPGFEVKYRFWSAVFGAAAVALTGALGTRLFRPAVGLVAGLLLLTNRSFLLDHGARFGGMDAALAACMAAVLWLYWVGRTRAGGIWPWACVGLAAGAASLFKPLAGLPMLAVIGLHAVFTRRDDLADLGESPQSRGVSPQSGPAGPEAVAHSPAPEVACPRDGEGAEPVARPGATRPGSEHGPKVSWPLALVAVLIVAAAAAGPWYWINHQRFPDAFVRYLLGQQIVGSMSDETGDADAAWQPWFFYLLKVPMSSTLWALAVPAAVWLAVAAARDARRRPALLLLAIAGIGWVAGFSAPGKKFLHYAYPAFPALAVAMAACLAGLLAFAARRLRPAAAAAPMVAGGLRLTVVWLLGFAGYLGLVALPSRASPLPTWALYKTFEPAIRDGRANLLFWGVPHRTDAWPDERLIRPNHMIYLSHMAGGRAVRDPAELAVQLASGRPTLLVFARDQDLSSFPALHPAGHRLDERFTVEQRPYSVLAVDTAALLAPALRTGRPSPYLRFAGSTAVPATTVPATAPAAAAGTEVAEAADSAFRFTGGEFALDVTLPLPEPARLTMLIKSADGQPRRRVRCVVSGVRDEPTDLQPMEFAGSHRVAVTVEPARGAADLRRTVRVQLVPVDGGGTDSVAGELVEAVLYVTPRWSASPDAR